MILDNETKSVRDALLAIVGPERIDPVLESYLACQTAARAEHEVLCQKFVDDEMTPTEFAHAINANSALHLQPLGEVMGAEAFEQMFDCPPDQILGLVDPGTAERYWANRDRETGEVQEPDPPA